MGIWNIKEWDKKWYSSYHLAHVIMQSKLLHNTSTQSTIKSMKESDLQQICCQMTQENKVYFVIKGIIYSNKQEHIGFCNILVFYAWASLNPKHTGKYTCAYWNCDWILDNASCNLQAWACTVVKLMEILWWFGDCGLYWIFFLDNIPVLRVLRRYDSQKWSKQFTHRDRELHQQCWIMHIHIAISQRQTHPIFPRHSL